MGVNMAIGELDVQSRPGRHLAGVAQHGAVGGAHQSEAARQDILIAEGGEQLGLTVETAARAIQEACAATAPSRGRDG